MHRKSALFLTLVALGCADPAADVTSATIESPAESPGTESPGTESPGTESPTAPTAESATAEPPAPTPLEALAIDPQNSRVEFVGAKVTESHGGGFRQFAGEIQLSAEDVTQSTVQLTIQTASTYADSDRLANHLMTDDFFDVAQFPTATFQSTGVGVGGEGTATHTVTGDLTLHGVTQRISFPATLAVSPTQLTVDAEFSIDRTDFGITYPGRVNDLIRDGVVLRFHLAGARPAG